MEHLRPHVEPTPVREPAAAPRVDPPEPGLLTWGDVVRFARRNLWIILGASFGLAAVMVVTFSILRPPKYQAVATLVVAPTKFRSDLKPPVLPIQGYQRLLESNAVVAATQKRLRDEGVLDSQSSLRIGGDLRTQIFVSRRAEETTLAPLIEILARASTPETAAAKANTWAEVFLEHARRVQAANISPMISLIENQYRDERERLLDLMSEEARLANEFQARLDELIRTWDRKLIEALKRTEDLVTAHNAESRRVMEDAAAEAGLFLVGAPPEGDAREGPQAAEQGEVERKLLQILALRTQLAQTPRLLVLEKAISDDTLWQTMALGQHGWSNLQPVLDRRMVTQEVNPVHDQLTLQLSQIETDLDTLASTGQLRVQRFAANLERLQSQRAAGLIKLLSDRALVSQELERQRSRDLQALERERRMTLEQAGAEVQYQTTLFRKLAENRNEAGLAEAEQTLEEVRLGAPAVPPGEPQPRRLLLLGLVTAFVGGLLGAVIALIREVEPEEVG